MVPAACGCSLAFLSPVGTPPNAIAFSTGRTTVREMALTGGLLTSVVLVFLAVATVTSIPAVIGNTSAPSWATGPCEDR